jgi:hypothetical protein
MGYGTTIVQYDGTDVGKIYLRDVGQRNQLGGGKGIFVEGQDQYITAGGDATFISTSDVMLSATSGVIKSFETSGSFTVTITPDS